MKRFAVAVTGGVLSACLIGGVAQAQTATAGATKDTTLYEFPTGDLGNGSGAYMFAGRTGQVELSIRRAVLAFDIASVVPAGSTITGVSLRLYMSKTPTGASTQSLHRTMANWGEGASNDSGEEGNGTGAQTGDATWLHTFYSDSFWTTPGGDFAGVASASTVVSGVGFYTWSGAGLISDVQSWLDAPSTNFGWTILGDESQSRTSKRYNTSENGSASTRPQLTINYVVPAPGTLVPLGAGLLLAARRRRATARA